MSTRGSAFTERLFTAARLLMGAIYLVNGLNWWVKLITPYPSQSDFVHFLPPPDVVGAMIENGVLFHFVKLAELTVGLCLLANRFVPLALVIAMPLTLPVFVVDVFFIAHLRGQVMGWGSLVLNVSLLLAYFGHFHSLLAPRGVPTAHARTEGTGQPNDLAQAIARLYEPAMPLIGVVAVAMGLAMATWLAVMMVQYQLDPKPLGALFPLKPRI